MLATAQGRALWKKPRRRGFSGEGCRLNGICFAAILLYPPLMNCSSAPPLCRPDRQPILDVPLVIERDPASEHSWQVLIVDDDDDVHTVTQLVLADVQFNGKPLQLLHARSSVEALACVSQTPDVAVILLDVVMETESAGLDIARHIRESLGNRIVQIILRTGYPGYAPEEKVIVDYEINDYKAKSELTSQRLITSVLASLRAYEHLTTIHQQNTALVSFANAANRFVPQEYLGMLKKRSIVEVVLGDKIQQDMTIVFIDVRSFSVVSERLTPTKTLDFVNELLSLLCPIIHDRGGFIDKYLGDGLLALFPRRVDDALDAVADIRAMTATTNSTRATRGEDPIVFGIGVHYGALVMGVIGQPERLEATVIGDVVNSACHIESMTKHFGVDVVVSEIIVERSRAVAASRFEFLARAPLKGRVREIGLFKLLA